MRVLFVNANLYGHINPTLGLVKELTKRGNEVSYFCEEPFSKQVMEAGAKWIGYRDSLSGFLKQYRPTDRHPFFMLMEYILQYDEVMLSEILEVIKEESYDLILCDSIFGGGCFLNQIVKIPVVCSHSSFAMSHAPVPERMLVPGFHPQLDHCYEVLHRICEKYQIMEPSLTQVFTSKGALNIVYTTPKFNGDEGVHEPEYLFAGPSMERAQNSEELDLSVVGERKLIYISLGSINTDFIDFYKMCIQAFGDSDYYVCMSIGKKFDKGQLGDIPSNFLVKSFLPQLAILKHADVFITHAGFNSVNEAIYYGVPMFALPQVNDQYMVAKRIVTMQLGLSENIKELTEENLRAKIKFLMTEEKFKTNCMQMSQEMKESAKLKQTVMALENYAAAWNERD